MGDYLRFTRELIALRRRHDALRRGRIRVFHRHSGNRVLAYQRWIEGIGGDVVIATSLAESTYFGYRIGFPGGGHWREIFNSDVYDGWVNPLVFGNGEGVDAVGDPLHGMPCSAGIVLPANGFVVFSRRP